MILFWVFVCNLDDFFPQPSCYCWLAVSSLQTWVLHVKVFPKPIFASSLFLMNNPILSSAGAVELQSSCCIHYWTTTDRRSPWDKEHFFPYPVWHPSLLRGATWVCSQVCRATWFCSSQIKVAGLRQVVIVGCGEGGSTAAHLPATPVVLWYTVLVL